MSDEPSWKEWLTVADGARLLGISRNDMHRIRVPRYRLWQTQCYRLDELLAWARRDLGSPSGMLKQLREKKLIAELRNAKRDIPYTKTGKIKKRVLASIPCPKCGGNLIQKRPPDILAQPELKKLLTKIGGASSNLQAQHDKLYAHAARLKKRIIHGCCGTSVFLKLEKECDQVDSYTDQLDALLKGKPVLCCSKCGATFTQSHTSTDDYDYDDEPRPIDDDMRAMTSADLDEGSGDDC